MEESKKKFELGQTVVTRGVFDAMQSDPVFGNFVGDCLMRHQSGDWGDLDPEDARSNDEAVTSGEDRIFSSYIYKKCSDEKIWIITEWDRSVTTILFPHEY